MWDVRDVLGLVPGVAVASWLGTRAAGYGLAWAVRFIRRLLAGQQKDTKDTVGVVLQQANGSASTNASLNSGQNALGLQLEMTGTSASASGGGGVGSRMYATSPVPLSAPADVDRGGGGGGGGTAGRTELLG